MAREVYITTIDNPFDPKEQPMDWRRFDHDFGYFSNELVARLATVSEAFPEKWNDVLWEDAIDRACKMHNYAIYVKKVYFTDEKDTEEIKN